MLDSIIPKVVPVPIRVYIAGALTADTHEEIKAHIDVAGRYQDHVFALGHRPFCPHTMTGHLTMLRSQCTEEHLRLWLKRDFEWLRLCDGLLLLPGWTQSRGSIFEQNEAQRLGRWVFEDISQIPRLELNELAAHMMRRRDAFYMECRKRLISGTAKYGNDWTWKDNNLEARFEAYDGHNYWFFGGLAREREAMIADGLPWPPANE